eukprot:SAG22_NODE_4834_length_1155_cov_1.185606_2_plen_113_part_00
MCLVSELPRPDRASEPVGTLRRHRQPRQRQHRRHHGASLATAAAQLQLQPIAIVCLQLPSIPYRSRVASPCVIVCLQLPTEHVLLRLGLQLHVNRTARVWMLDEAGWDKVRH